MNLRLLAGRLAEAWLEYPCARRRLAEVPAGPPIFLTGTHRSGTTWLAGMLAASGTWYVHEPFAPMKGRWLESFSYRGSHEPDHEVDALFQDVLAGRFRAALGIPNSDHPLMPLRLFGANFGRLLIKDPLACLLCNYLTVRYDLKTLILFRHPAGFVSSLCRLGWPRAEFLRRFLADERLMADHLEPYRSLIERFSKEENVESAAVLHGALNVVLWSNARSGIGTAVQYEDLCRDPMGGLKGLYDQLGLPYDDCVREFHRAACFGLPKGVDAYHPHSVSRNSLASAESWKCQLSSGEVLATRRIWESFEIPLYRDTQDWSMARAGGQD